MLKCWSVVSGGAVVLVRIKDKELLFYGKCGEHPNPHSAEILPDIKSISDSPDGIIMLKPRESWWLDNDFSYSEDMSLLWKRGRQF